ncbi:MAG: LLM class flavin-dependent oxidoreductase [Chloroflexi bacterium]|nr:LLM class flavin-dependent oxidoreductase [Chloroflexota bacterium]
MKKGSQPLVVGMIPLETRRDIIVHLATRADQLGYDAVSLPETWAHDATVLLGEIALKTEQIRIGTGILGIWGRSAAQIAMASTTLNVMSNGRFMLGLGSSTKQLTEGLHDVHYKAPYKKLRQTLIQIRALLRGERIPLTADSEARPLQLNLPPQPEIPILLAASSPKSIRLAGELCDGWLPFLFPRDTLAGGIAHFHEGAAQSDDSPRTQQIIPIIPTVVSEDLETAREKAAWIVAFYLIMMGPVYRNALVRLGFKQEVEAVLAANVGKKPAIVPDEAEALLEQVTIYGTPDQVQKQLHAWYRAGADMPGLMLGPNLTKDEVDFTLKAFRG